MAVYFLDKAGLETFWTKVKEYYSASTADSRIGYAVKAGSAGKLTATKTLSLTGDATGSVTTDFSSNPSISVTIKDATTSTHGMMSATDKARFDSLATIKSINETATVTTSDGLSLGTDGKLTLKIKDYVTSSAFNTYKTEVSNALDLKSPLASPSFTGTIKVNNKKVLDEDEVDTAIKSYVSGAEVLRFKGVVDATTFNALTSYTKGDTYKAKADGTYAGNVCEAGDMIICTSSYGTAFANTDWSVIQTNIDGYIIGPASATDGNIPLFDGTTGKLLKNSSYSPSSFLPSSTTYAGSSSKGGAATSANKLNTNAGNATTPVYFANGVPVALGYTIAKSVPSSAVFTDTDTKVTEVGNHYTPTGTVTKSADASSTTPATYGKTSLVTGVNLTVDAAGHLTDISLDSIMMPAQYSHPTHTAYASGLYKVTVNNLGHVTSATAVSKTDITNLGIPGANTWRSISVDDVSKLTDTATALNLLSGDNISITYDTTKKGIQFDVTDLGQLAYKDSLTYSDVGALPDTTAYIKSITKSGNTLTVTPSSGDVVTFSNTVYSVATTTVNGLMSSTDKSKLDGIAAGAQVNTITGIKGNAETTYRTGNVNITPANIGALPSSTAFIKSITKSGGTLTITPSSGSAITFTDTDTVYTHPTSGVTAGTYRSVTVDANGHVTKGTNPTTLSGYGITDAKIASGVITLGGTSITPLTSHQDISGKADKATTLAGYGITDACIVNGVITLGENTITPLTSHQTVANGGNTASWGKSVTVGTVGGTALTFTMPANPNTNTTYTFATGTANGTFSVTPSGGTAQSVAIKGLGSLAYKSSLSAGDVGALPNTTTYIKSASLSGTTLIITPSSGDAVAFTANNYSLPTATATILGGVKIGSNITVSSGSISLSSSNVTNALGYTPANKAGDTFTGAVSIIDTTESTSTTTGALKVSGGVGVAGDLYASKVYNATWNDLADCIPVNEDAVIEAGYCYCFDGEKYYKSTKYMDEGIIGIQSDTYGMHMGHKEGVNQMDVAVAGFVLAYVDKEYSVGTPLTCGENGILTEIKKQDKIEYPERIIATYWKNETLEYWGSEKEKIAVAGRKWVKIK